VAVVAARFVGVGDGGTGLAAVQHVLLVGYYDTGLETLLAPSGSKPSVTWQRRRSATLLRRWKVALPSLPLLSILGRITSSMVPISISGAFGWTQRHEINALCS
jgi:hypothetical protein